MCAWCLRIPFSILILLIGHFCPVAYAIDGAESVQWQTVTEDLEKATISLPINLFSSARIDLFRTSTKRFRMSVARATEFGSKTSDVKTLCQATKGIVCINANFFDEQYRPLGLIIEKGIVLQKLHRGGNTLTGIIQQTRDSISIVNRLDFYPGKILEAVQAGPRLIARGQPVQGLREGNVSLRRSGICVDPDKRLILFALTSSFFGPSVADLQKTLLRRDIACWDALNLDGGSSTQLYFAGANSNDNEVFKPYEVAGESEIPVILSLVARE